MKRLVVILMIGLGIAAHALAGEKGPVPLTDKDRCPVCGMYVARYPEFIAQIVFKDGSYAVFDGAKDMYKYYLEMEKYDKVRKAGDIDSIYVTDYYDVSLIDARSAYYVKGSSVYGPMGKELITLGSKEAAEEFMVDHSGDSILRFHDVTMEVIKPLD